jgi:hypothetical protein
VQKKRERGCLGGGGGGAEVLWRQKATCARTRCQKFVQGAGDGSCLCERRGEGRAARARAEALSGAWRAAHSGPPPPPAACLFHSVLPKFWGGASGVFLGIFDVGCKDALREGGGGKREKGQYKARGKQGCVGERQGGGGQQAMPTGTREEGQRKRARLYVYMCVWVEEAKASNLPATPTQPPQKPNVWLFPSTQARCAPPAPPSSRRPFNRPPQSRRMPQRAPPSILCFGCRHTRAHALSAE